MRDPLPAVEVLRRTARGAYLAWEDAERRDWCLPGGVTLSAEPPGFFGFACQRRRFGYRVAVRWDGRRLAWRGLSRDDLLRGDLGSLLAAVGVDLWELLEATADAPMGGPSRAA